MYRLLNRSLAVSLLVQCFVLQTCFGADNLRLRPGISFVHDLDKGFPILADHLDDMKIESGKINLIFFAASGDLNSNRQSRRIVDLYKKYKDQIKFIIVDVDHPSGADTKQLIKAYYQGYIPQQVVIDKQGRTFWTHLGESDGIAAQLEKCLQ
jgi:hypothetical protein